MMASKSFGSRPERQGNGAKSRATKRPRDASKRIVGVARFLFVQAVRFPQTPLTPHPLSRMEASGFPATSLDDFSALDAMAQRGKACKDDGTVPASAKQHKWKQAS